MFLLPSLHKRILVVNQIFHITRGGQLLPYKACTPHEALKIWPWQHLKHKIEASNTFIDSKFIVEP
jgi:hypothetical protein